MRSGGGVTRFVVSPRDRFLSRVGFYTAVVLLLWASNRLDAPRTVQIPGWSDEELGVARAYIGSSEWPEIARKRQLPMGR